MSAHRVSTTVIPKLCAGILGDHINAPVLKDITGMVNSVKVGKSVRFINVNNQILRFSPWAFNLISKKKNKIEKKRSFSILSLLISRQWLFLSNFLSRWQHYEPFLCCFFETVRILFPVYLVPCQPSVSMAF